MFQRCLLFGYYISQSGAGRGTSFGEKSAACGRMVCDVKISAKELIRVRSYDLTELVHHVLKQKRIEVDYDSVRNMYRYV